MAPRKFKTREKRIVSSHGGWRVMSGAPVFQSNGTTQVSGTDRMNLVLNCDAKELQFVFVNGYADTTGKVIPNGNAIKLHMGVEITGNLLPVRVGGATGTAISSGGKSENVIGDGEMEISQVLPSAALPAAGTITYRIYKKVGAGEKWPNTLDKSHANTGFSGTTDFVYGSTIKDGTDQTTAYADSGYAAFASSAYTFGPIAVIGRQVNPVSVVMVTGDSISAGVGSVTNLGRGYIGKACADAGVAYHVDGVSGVTLDNLCKYSYMPQYLSNFVDHVVVHALTNDFHAAGISFATAKTILLKALRSFGTQDNKLWFSTVLPRGTNASASSYATQVLVSWEATRVEYNNWLRDGSANGGLAYLRANLPLGVQVGGIIDACPGIERNSDGSALVLDGNGQQTNGTGGYWLMGATGDFVHPNDTGVGLMSPYVPTASFTY